MLPGLPILQFALGLEHWPGRAPPGSLQAMLEERFAYYKQHLVQGFYQQHFASFDRQIVLVDCLQPQTVGLHFRDLEQTLALLMRGFHYGQSNWLRLLPLASTNYYLLPARRIM